MARTVQTRFKSSLPGSGFDSAGSAKQGKRRVSGVISVTSYTDGGVSLTPNDIGLSAIDFISLKHQDESANTEGRGQRSVLYNNSSADFYITQITGAGLEAAATGSTHTVRFDALGDSADDVELT